MNDSKRQKYMYVIPSKKHKIFFLPDFENIFLDFMNTATSFSWRNYFEADKHFDGTNRESFKFDVSTIAREYFTTFWAELKKTPNSHPLLNKTQQLFIFRRRKSSLQFLMTPIDFIVR